MIVTFTVSVGTGMIVLLHADWAHSVTFRRRVARRAPPVRRTQHGRAASPMLAHPHRVAASTLCCIAMRACSDLIMRLGADSVACGCGRRYRPVGGPCPAPTLTVPARLACDGRRLMVLLAIVIERCVQRSQNVPSIALQLPLPRACFHVLLPLHSLCPLRAGR